jgi:hypothetical protein
VLKKIEKVLGRSPVNKAKITDLTNQFYSLIPYVRFRFISARFLLSHCVCTRCVMPGMTLE